MGTTTNYSLPYPELNDPLDVQGDQKKLAEKVDEIVYSIDKKTTFNDTGSATNPIYFMDGIPIASNKTVGSGIQPTYLLTGNITASDSTVGDASTPIYMNNGTLKECTNTKYVSDGGSSSTPVYISGGEAKEITSLDISGNAKIGSKLTMVDPLNYSADIIRVMGDGTGSYGTELIIRGNGNTFVGAGESPYNLEQELVGGGALSGESYSQDGERLYLTADTEVYIESNSGTIANRQAVKMTTGGVFQAATSGASIVANKLGTSTVGSSTQPIYLSSGTATASSSTVGSSTKPIYLSSGTLTASSSTVGSSTVPIYLSSGTLTASSSTVGSSTVPIYLSSGTLTASSSTVGSSTKPIYLSSGTLTASSSTVGSSTKPIYLSSGTLTASSSTVGSGTKPIYLSSGTLVVSSSTVGSGTKPIYLSTGTLTASSSTVGYEWDPVYLNNGVLTECGDPIINLALCHGTYSDANGRFAQHYSGPLETFPSGANGTSSYIDFHYKDWTSDYTHRIIASSASGSLTAYPSIVNNSDERLKTSIHNIDEKYLELLDVLHPRLYQLKRAVDKLGDTAPFWVGLVAQEVIEAEKSVNIDYNEQTLVQGTGEDTGDPDIGIDYYSFDYSSLSALLLAGYQKLKARIDILEEKLSNL